MLVLVHLARFGDYGQKAYFLPIVVASAVVFLLNCAKPASYLYRTFDQGRRQESSNLFCTG